jgi:endonuclease-3
MLDTKLLMRRLMLKYKNELHTSLDNTNEVELFVAVLLSPQNSDMQVNKVTKNLFKKYRSFGDYAKASVRELEKDLSSLNFYKTKAKHLKESAEIIEEEFHGHLPRKMNDLLKLPGVGRKIANIVMNEAYGISEGIAIDTHCITVSNRLGLVHSRDPEYRKGAYEKDTAQVLGICI